MLIYGGIYPITPPEEDLAKDPLRCYHCGKFSPALDHYFEAKKMYMHGKCVEAFLETREGKSFLAEGFEVLISIDGSLKKLS